MIKDTVLLSNRPEKHFLGSLYFKNIKSGIDYAFEGTGFKLLYTQQDNSLADILASKKQKIAGIIDISPFINDNSVKLLEKENKYKSVLINCRSAKLGWVDLDNVRGAMTMTEHLIKLGHEKILYIAGFQESQNNIDRFKGFKNALGKYNIKFNPRLILTCDFSITLAYERMKEFLSHDRKSFTAIFAANDLMAVGAIRALIDERIRTPEDIAVVGFDDFDFASTFYIPLTTYRQPFKNLGYIAARSIVTANESNRCQQQQVELVGEIVVRKSCGSKIS
ncbi:MAG: substrate-binding domain-containing protein [Elusimicrobia bacterium]|nr:substrate-binding domain-containing protein [Elusimicrobiota bacterium]